MAPTAAPRCGHPEPAKRVNTRNVFLGPDRVRTMTSRKTGFKSPPWPSPGIG